MCFKVELISCCSFNKEYFKILKKNKKNNFVLESVLWGLSNP